MTSPHRMRRQARRIRRGGMQPMMLITGNDQLPESAVVLAFRWAWRYRSELAPLYAAGAVLGIADWLHADHRHWWVLVLTIAVVAAGALMTFGRTWLAALTERLYAAVTVLAAGGWAATAAILGPFRTPMPQLLAAGAAGPVGALVGAWPPPRQGPRRAQARGLAGDRPGGRAGRLAGHVRPGGRVGLAGPAAPGPGPDHHRRDRQDSGPGIGPGHAPGSRSRLPHS